MASYDWSMLYKTFSDLVTQYMGLTQIELNSNGSPPPAPYIAFDVISPNIPINEYENDESNAFEAAVSFTVYAKSKVEALNLAQKWRDMLNTQHVLIALQAADVVVVERMATNIRYIQETASVAAMVGFDVMLRLHSPFADEDMDTITKVDFISKGAN
ncbi:phage neck terminator protein [Loigolactobacillus bifermentans]|nr:hypothetical protein [Loigolactobacillus bifermentans]QGG59551.1 hypothetical protein LB003_03125 [Loigolactobacillus bifermentans]